MIHKTPLLVLLALAVFTASIMAQEGAFSDVPTGHWAYEAVERLADEGLLEGFPDGSFLGSQPMTRYQMAIIVARLVDRIDILEETISSSSTPQSDLSDMVADLAVQVQNLKVATRQIEEAIRVAPIGLTGAGAYDHPPLLDKPQQGPVAEAEFATQASVDEMDAEIRSLITKLSVEFKEEIALVAQSEAIHRQRIDELSVSVSNLEQQVKALRLRLEEGNLTRDSETYGSEIEALRTRVTQQDQTIQRLYILCIVATVAGLLIK